MKKFLMLLAFASVSMLSFAQDTDPVEKYSVATNSFWSNWFIQVGGDFNSWISNEEHSRDLNNGDHFGLFSGKRTTFGGSVAIGKWFTPGLGLRTKIQAWNGKKVNSSNPETFKFWMVHEHIMFNLSNLLYGYNPNRVWNLIPFAGGGIGRTMSSNRYAMILGVGLQSSWRLSKHVNFYLEGGWNRAEEDLDGDWSSTMRDNRGWESKDNQLYAEVGLTFNLGKATWKKTPDVDAIKALSQSQIDALSAQLNDANAENERLKEMLANQKPAEVQVVKEFASVPISVFFNLDKSKIASRKDLVNVGAVAKYAKENNCNILVTGYCDSATGSVKYNQGLSERRANRVADELVKLGVDRDRIQTRANGGVDDLSPVSFNRRATIEVTK
ncbi:OmpA family protein [Prevotella sp. A2931]|uniref:OmpA family protein n=1 Tax=Prevotella illustrans TaxID=2800387 RepID=A0ABS3M6P5_9BACT|nr:MULTISPECIES: OmpA family protein [Prevotella]MBO1363851.1 OmpA family protein [Prevotella illustrans]PTL27114.1 cell envelope biogenesis protein OmpA [Prevotella sp. oral taxon 820]